MNNLKYQTLRIYQSFAKFALLYPQIILEAAGSRRLRIIRNLLISPPTCTVAIIQFTSNMFVISKWPKMRYPVLPY